VRLGNILVIVQIHAEPAMLPLPTLSKVDCSSVVSVGVDSATDYSNVRASSSPQGRLPIDNKAIDEALERAMTLCLRQLQVTSASLLLTASELRVAERDARYVPAVALALASILSKSDIKTQAGIVERVQNWEPGRSDLYTVSSKPSTTLHAPNHNATDVKTLAKTIEGRLRLVLASSRKPNRKKLKGHIGPLKKQSAEEVNGETSEIEATSNLVEKPSNSNEANLTDSVESLGCSPPQPKLTAASESEIAPDGDDYSDWL
jgi:hypothetical protein